jgi:chromosome segregation ATPase
MSNVRVLTGGLVVIVLALAGGTGYLIYDRIQNEVGTSAKATQAEVQEIRGDVTQLKDSDTKQTARIKVLESEVIDAKRRLGEAEGKLDLHNKMIAELEKDVDKNKGDIESAKQERKKLQQDADAAKKRMDNVDTELAQAKKERQEIRKQLEAQGARIEEQEKRVEKLEQQGEKRDQELEALKAELAELKKLLGVDDTKKPSN